MEFDSSYTVIHLSLFLPQDHLDHLVNEGKRARKVILEILAHP